MRPQSPEREATFEPRIFQSAIKEVYSIAVDCVQTNLCIVTVKLSMKLMNEAVIGDDWSISV